VVRFDLLLKSQTTTILLLSSHPALLFFLFAEGAGAAGSAGVCTGPVLSPGTYQTPLSPIDLEVLKLHVATMQAYLDLCRGNAARALNSVEAVIASKAGPPQLLFTATLYRAEALVRLGEFFKVPSESKPVVHILTADATQPTPCFYFSLAGRLDEAKQTLQPDANSHLIQAAHAPVAPAAAPDNSDASGEGEGAASSTGHDYSTGYKAVTTGVEQSKVGLSELWKMSGRQHCRDGSSLNSCPPTPHPCAAGHPLAQPGDRVLQKSGVHAGAPVPGAGGGRARRL